MKESSLGEGKKIRSGVKTGKGFEKKNVITTRGTSALARGRQVGDFLRRFPAKEETKMVGETTGWTH